MSYETILPQLNAQQETDKPNLLKDYVSCVQDPKSMHENISAIHNKSLALQDVLKAQSITQQTIIHIFDALNTEYKDVTPDDIAEDVLEQLIQFRDAHRMCTAKLLLIENSSEQNMQNIIDGADGNIRIVF